MQACERIFQKKVRACCNMGCILRTYFRGGLVSIANEVGVLEGTTKSLLALKYVQHDANVLSGELAKPRRRPKVQQNARIANKADVRS